MKRTLAWLVTAALICIAAGNAGAEAVKTTSMVLWRSSTAVNTVPAGYVDSATVRHAAVAADTTAPIPMADWTVMPALYKNPATTGVDSLPFAIFYMEPVNQNLATTSDSVYVGAQVSMDGSTWVATTPTQTFVAATLSGDSHNGAALLENAASNSFTAVIKQATAVTGYSLSFASATVPTWINMYGWRYIRFIVHSDFNGEYRAWIARWEEKGIIN